MGGVWGCLINHKTWKGRRGLRNVCPTPPRRWALPPKEARLGFAWTGSGATQEKAPCSGPTPGSQRQVGVGVCQGGGGGWMGGQRCSGPKSTCDPGSDQEGCVSCAAEQAKTACHLLGEGEMNATKHTKTRSPHSRKAPFLGDERKPKRHSHQRRTSPCNMKPPPPQGVHTGQSMKNLGQSPPLGTKKIPLSENSEADKLKLGREVVFSS